MKWLKWIRLGILNKEYRKLSGFFNSRRAAAEGVEKFSADLRDMTTRIGFSFANDGWHPFVQTLKEYEANPDLTYENSTLFRLYRQFQPKNLQEVLLDGIDFPLVPICTWPPSNLLLKKIWTIKKEEVSEPWKNGRNSQAWIYFGPHGREYGQWEFHRLIAVYESIKSNGYDPILSRKTPVDGYFLQKGAVKRFVLLQGNHRVAALKVLGYSWVEARFRPGHPQVIHWDQLNNGSGVLPTYILKQFFLMLFQENGLKKAQRYGLAPEGKMPRARFH